MTPFSSQDVADIDELYRKRMDTVLAVDDMVGSLVQELEADGQLENGGGIPHDQFWQEVAKDRRAKRRAGSKDVSRKTR